MVASNGGGELSFTAKGSRVSIALVNTGATLDNAKVLAQIALTRL